VEVGIVGNDDGIGIFDAGVCGFVSTG